MKRKVMGIGAVLAGAAVVYLGWAAMRAHQNLVTLDVRNMEVREVVKKIEWQTWEDIFVNKEVQGKVTLKVTRQPLERVLGMVASQTSSRSATLYPLYSTGKSFTSLKKALRGEGDPMTNGWTNLQARTLMRGPMFAGGPGGPAGMMMQTTQAAQPITFNIYGKDVAFASLAFSRFAQTRVVPEDGAAQRPVNMMVKNAKVTDAVAKLAEAAGLKWKRLYALQAGFRGGPPNERRPGPDAVFARNDGGTNGPALTRQTIDTQRREQREAMEAELLQVLPADQQAKITQAQEERAANSQGAPGEGTGPGAGGPRMQQMSASAMNQMNRERVLNTTPEQRAQRRDGPMRRMVQR